MMTQILIVLPTFNEEKILVHNTTKVLNYVKNHLPEYQWKIIIADNGSTDQTPKLAAQLAEKYNEINYFHIDLPGRGRALKKAWTENSADIYTYMDIDLAVNLTQLQALLLPLIKKQADIVTGSRYQKSSHVKRSLSRALLSRIYNLILRLALKLKIKDAQCGFKAINQKTVNQLVPQTKNTNWFFDTELLTLAQNNNFQIKEIAVQWIEPRKRTSKVKIIATIYEYFKEISQYRKTH